MSTFVFVFLKHLLQDQLTQTIDFDKISISVKQSSEGITWKSRKLHCSFVENDSSLDCLLEEIEVCRKNEKVVLSMVVKKLTFIRFVVSLTVFVDLYSGK